MHAAMETEEKPARFTNVAGISTSGQKQSQPGEVNNLKRCGASSRIQVEESNYWVTGNAGDHTVDLVQKWLEGVSPPSDIDNQSETLTSDTAITRDRNRSFGKLVQQRSD